MAYKMHKLAGVMHAVVVADGALEARCAWESSNRHVLKSSRSGKIAIRTAERARWHTRCINLQCESEVMRTFERASLVPVPTDERLQNMQVLQGDLGK